MNSSVNCMNVNLTVLKSQNDKQKTTVLTFLSHDPTFVLQTKVGFDSSTLVSRYCAWSESR
jgi:hypothetical protein